MDGIDWRAELQELRDEPLTAVWLAGNLVGFFLLAALLLTA